MHTAAVVITLVALVVGVAGAVQAVSRLRRGSPAGSGRNRQLAVVLLGFLVLMNAVVQLFRGSSGVALAGTLVSLGILAAFVYLFSRPAEK